MLDLDDVAVLQAIGLAFASHERRAVVGREFSAVMLQPVYDLMESQMVGEVRILQGA